MDYGGCKNILNLSISQGLSDRGSFGSSNTWNDGAVPQLNSQTQQILNMMQTQQLLAAVQAQASIANSGPPSLMQNQIQGFPRQGGRNQRNDNQGRRDRFRSAGGGGGGGRYRDDRKRKSSPPRNPLPKRDRRENNSQATRLVTLKMQQFLSMHQLVSFGFSVYNSNDTVKSAFSCIIYFAVLITYFPNDPLKVLSNIMF